MIRQSINSLPDIVCRPVNFVIRMVPVTIVMGTIFFLSHQCGDTLNLPSFPGADKLAHMFAYGTLAFTVLWYFGKKGVDRPWLTLTLTVLFCLFYGISDEFHQSFIPLRSVSAFDLLADTAGAFCISIIWLMSPALQQQLIVYQNKAVKYLSFGDR